MLAAAEQAGFTVFVTTDQNLRYQQNLKERRITIVVLPTTRWPDIKPHSGKIREALHSSRSQEITGSWFGERFGTIAET